jgi:hypothetical protein
MKWIKRTGIGKALCLQRLEQRKIILFYDIKREIVYSLEEATNLDAMDSDFTHFAQQLMSINNIKWASECGSNSFFIISTLNIDLYYVDGHWMTMAA